MKKFKKVMTLLLVLSMVMMSGMSAFADGDVPPQDDSIPVSETENTAQTENQQLEETAIPSDKPEDISGNQDVQQTEDDTKDELVSDDKSTESTDAAGTEGTSGTEGAGENTPESLSTTEENGQTQVATQPDYKETSVYLRYTNEVPEDIIKSYAPEGFGPVGMQGVPYFKVNVDLNKILELCEQDKIQVCTKDGLTYYSAQADPNQGGVTKDAAVSCWEAILEAIPAEEQKIFKDYFGVSGIEGKLNFIGYVFKSEADGWHIDGILDVKPGYVTEFYLNDTIMKTDVAKEAMTMEAAKKKIEEMLGAVSGTIKWNSSGMGGTYEKDNNIYRFTIKPNEGYSASDNKVQYVTKIEDAYYLAGIYVNTEKTGAKPVPVEPKAAVYEVRYHLQQPNGSYEMVEGPFRLYAEIGSSVTASQMTFEGYIFNTEKSNPSGKVTAPKRGDNGSPEYLVLNMYYDTAAVQPPVVPIEPQPPVPPYTPVPPADPTPDPVNPVEPVNPQPLPPDEFLEEPDKPAVNPQPLPPDEFLEEPDKPAVNPQPLPPDDPLIENDDPNQPKTGDETPLMALTGLFLISAGALGAICIKKKKEK